MKIDDDGLERTEWRPGVRHACGYERLLSNGSYSDSVGYVMRQTSVCPSCGELNRNMKGWTAFSYRKARQPATLLRPRSLFASSSIEYKADQQATIGHYGDAALLLSELADAEGGADA